MSILTCWLVLHPPLERQPHLLPLGPVRYSSHPLSMGDTFQDPQWMPETTDSTKPYTYRVKQHRFELHGSTYNMDFFQ